MCLLQSRLLGNSVKKGLTLPDKCKVNRSRTPSSQNTLLRTSMTIRSGELELCDRTCVGRKTSEAVYVSELVLCKTRLTIILSGVDRSLCWWCEHSPLVFYPYPNCNDYRNFKKAFMRWITCQLMCREGSKPLCVTFAPYLWTIPLSQRQAMSCLCNTVMCDQRGYSVVLSSAWENLYNRQSLSSGHWCDDLL